MTTTEWPAITVGAILGDSDTISRAWGEAIGALSMQVSDSAQDTESPIRLGIEFHVDGRLRPNEFEGVRTGRFSKANRRLIVQVAAPGGPIEDKRPILVEGLGEAVQAAEQFVQKRKLADGLPELRDLIAKLPAI